MSFQIPKINPEILSSLVTPELSLGYYDFKIRDQTTKHKSEIKIDEFLDLLRNNDEKALNFGVKSKECPLEIEVIEDDQNNLKLKIHENIEDYKKDLEDINTYQDRSRANDLLIYKDYLNQKIEHGFSKEYSIEDLGRGIQEGQEQVFSELVNSLAKTHENSRKNTLQYKLFEVFGYYFLTDVTEDHSIKSIEKDDKTFFIKDNKISIITEDGEAIYSDKLEDIFQMCGCPHLYHMIDNLNSDFNANITTFDDLKKLDNEEYKTYLLTRFRQDYYSKLHPEKATQILISDYMNKLGEACKNQDKNILDFLKDESILKLDTKKIEENNLEYLTVNDVPFPIIHQKDNYYVIKVDLQLFYDETGFGSVLVVLSIPEERERAIQDIIVLDAPSDNGDFKLKTEQFLDYLTEIENLMGLEFIENQYGNNALNFIAKIDEKNDTPYLKNTIEQINIALQTDYTEGLSHYFRSNFKKAFSHFRSGYYKNQSYRLMEKNTKFKDVIPTELVESNRIVPFQKSNTDLTSYKLKQYLSRAYQTDDYLIYRSALNLAKDLGDIKWDTYRNGYPTDLSRLYVELYRGSWDKTNRYIDSANRKQHLWRYAPYGENYRIIDRTDNSVPREVMNELEMARSFLRRDRNKDANDALDLVIDKVPEYHHLKEISELEKKCIKIYESANNKYQSYYSKYGSFGNIKSQNIKGVTSLGEFVGKTLVASIQEEYIKSLEVRIPKNSRLATTLLSHIQSKITNSQQIQIAKKLTGLELFRQYRKEEIANAKALNPFDSIPIFKNYIEAFKWADNVKKQGYKVTNDMKYALLNIFSKPSSPFTWRLSDKDQKVYSYHTLTANSMQRNEISHSAILGGGEIFEGAEIPLENLNKMEQRTLEEDVFSYFEWRGIRKETILSINKKTPNISYGVSIDKQNADLQFSLADDRYGILTQFEKKDINRYYYPIRYIPLEIRNNSNIKQQEYSNYWISPPEYEQLPEEKKAQYVSWLDYNQYIKPADYDKLEPKAQAYYEQKQKATRTDNTKLMKQNLHARGIETSFPTPTWNTKIGNSSKIEERNIFDNLRHRKLILSESPIDNLSVIEMCKLGENYSEFKKISEYTGFHNIDFKNDEVLFISSMGTGNINNLDLKEYIALRGIIPQNVYVITDNDKAGLSAYRNLKKEVPFLQSAIPTKQGQDMNEFYQKTLESLKNMGIEVTEDYKLVQTKTNEILSKKEVSQLMSTLVPDRDSHITQEMNDSIHSYTNSLINELDINAISDSKLWGKLINELYYIGEKAVTEMKESPDYSRMEKYQKEMDEILVNYRKLEESVTKQKALTTQTRVPLEEPSNEIEVEK